MKQTKYIILFILFVIAYMIAYSFHGYNDGDDGYLMGLSWRIFNGEIPYKDFISVRPPFSPFFHSLPMYLVPDNYQIIFERFFFYILVALTALFCSLSINKTFNLQQYQISPYLLATVGFVFSIHNFPPMPWYTVDGIFFASLGIYLLIQFSGNLSIILGILFLFFSALCKQPFYLMPVAGIIFIMFYRKNWKKTVLAIASFILFIGIFIFILHKTQSLNGFLTLTTGSTKISDLLTAGVFRYCRVYSLYLLIPLAFWVVAYKFSSIGKYSYLIQFVPYFFITFLLLYPLVQYWYAFIYHSVAYDPYLSYSYQDTLAVFLFIVLVFLFILNFKFEKNWVSLFFLSLLSWCSSVSWGNQSPDLFSTPLFFGFFIIAHQYFNVKNINRLATYVLILGAVTYFIGYQKPYGNPKRSELTYELSDIFPKLKNIYVGRITYEKYHEFHSLMIKHGRNFKTLPGMPLSSYLTDTKSPLPVDWVNNGETNNRNQSILKQLSNKNPVVFIEKEPTLITVVDSDEKNNSSVTYFIKQNWIKVDSTKHFDVYKNEL